MIFRKLPRLDSINRAFWTGGEQGDLNIQHCDDCQQFFHPPQPVCRHCMSQNVVPKAVSGKGTVDTFTVNYQKWHPQSEVPYVIARIALDDAPGVYITSNVIDCDPESVDIGQSVNVVFEQQEEVYLPLFKRVD
ncbi:Zn-ribbon domain-containing OB-fold protein [Halioxenophilus aromaticivorans]|uniref:DNA-binding protein n=1 Tax=Halioxenophilus aromaticivorans TaxID=1306992 RepID=A0AAV3U4V3_9ALTE